MKKAMKPILAVAALGMAAASCSQSLASEPGESGALELHTHYQVTARNFGLSDVRFAARTDGSSYGVTAEISPDGILGMLFGLYVSAKSRGWIIERSVQPVRYEATRTRKGEDLYRKLTYKEDGSVNSIEVKPPKDVAAEITTDKLMNTIDPVSLLFLSIKPTRGADLCDSEINLFDGQRYSKLIADPPIVDGDEATCSGRYIRLYGYPQREMDRGATQDFQVTFRRMSEVGGLFVLHEFRASSPYGEVVMSLTWSKFMYS